MQKVATTRQFDMLISPRFVTRMHVSPRSNSTLLFQCGCPVRSDIASISLLHAERINTRISMRAVSERRYRSDNFTEIPKDDNKQLLVEAISLRYRSKILATKIVAGNFFKATKSCRVIASISLRLFCVHLLLLVAFSKKSCGDIGLY